MMLMLVLVLMLMDGDDDDAAAYAAASAVAAPCACTAVRLASCRTLFFSGASVDRGMPAFLTACRAAHASASGGMDTTQARGSKSARLPHQMPKRVS